MSDPRRRLRLLLPSPDRRALATVGGRLPAIEASLRDDESTVTAAWRALPEIGLAGPLLTCAIDQRADDDLAGAVRQAVIVLEPPGPGWSPPSDWGWSPEPSVERDLPEPLDRVVRQWGAELSGRTSPPAQRAEWSRIGWHARVVGWIDEALVDAGRAPSTSIVQFRQWGISTVLRVDAPGGRCWFKAAFPGFRQEAAVTEWLDRTVSGAVPHVVAAEPAEGWLLLDDLGDRTQSDDAETTFDAIDRLVAIQRATVRRTDDLLAVGAPDRRLGCLVDDVAEALASPVAAEIVDTSRARELNAPLARAIACVDGVLPDGLVHGDFHPGNTAHTDGGAVVFDWSDAAITSPVVDVPTWTWWYEDDAGRVDHVWECFEAAWQREHGVATGSIDRRAVEAIAGGYHTVSYVRILEGLEPIARPEHADGVTHFFELLTDACRDIGDG